MKHQKLYRQGDVLLQRVDSVSKKAKLEKVEGRPTVAYGEMTGHHHSFLPGSVRLFRDQEAGTVFIEVPEAKKAISLPVFEDRPTRKMFIDDEGDKVPETVRVQIGTKPFRGAILEHQEHAPIPLPPGIYRHIQQRGYTPEAIRNVND